jgi:hypothetical protein
VVGYLLKLFKNDDAVVFLVIERAFLSSYVLGSLQRGVL